MAYCFKTFAIVFLVLAVLIGLRLKTLGAFDELPSDDHGEWKHCEVVEGVPASEDLVVSTTSDKVYITSLNFPAMIDTGELPPGFIFAYNGKDVKEMSLSGYDGQNFKPHGLSLIEQDSVEYLFVVDHGYNDDNHAVVIFKIQDNELVQHNVINSPLFRSLNTVVGVSLDEFYAVNDHYYDMFSNQLMNFIEDFLGLNWAFAVRWKKGEGVTIAAKDFSSPSPGIEFSKGKLFLAHTLEGTVSQYDTTTGNLEFTLDIGTGPDNLHFDAEGRLWVGSHMNIINTFNHLLKGEKGCSQVIYIETDGDNFDLSRNAKVTEVYRSCSGPVSGTSTGALYKKMLLLGTMRDGFGVCNK